MIDKWHQLCDKHFNVRMEVVVGSSHDFGLPQKYGGEFNTAIPRIDPKLGPLLMVLVSDTSLVDDILITHELGHCVLKLQGYVSLVNFDCRDAPEEIFLTSMAHHPALYELQRSLGHDPQEMIDARAKHNRSSLHLISTMPPKTQALYLADDAYNASPAIADAMLNACQPNVRNHVDTILEVGSHYDRLSPDGVRRFGISVVQSLGLRGRWGTLDDTQELAKLLHPKAGQ